MKFTKEETSLCKQVAERHKKTIEYGDWYFIKEHKPAVPMLWTRGDDCGYDDAIPILTISDCLEFLAERGLYLLGLNQSDECEFSCGFCETDDLGMRPSVENATWVDGETPLEACLKAVLAVLEEESK